MVYPSQLISRTARAPKSLSWCCSEYVFKFKHIMKYHWFDIRYPLIGPNEANKTTPESDFLNDGNVSDHFSPPQKKKLMLLPHGFNGSRFSKLQGHPHVEEVNWMSKIYIIREQSSERFSMYIYIYLIIWIPYDNICRTWPTWAQQGSSGTLVKENLSQHDLISTACHSL